MSVHGGWGCTPWSFWEYPLVPGPLWGIPPGLWSFTRGVLPSQVCSRTGSLRPVARGRKYPWTGQWGTPQGGQATLWVVYPLWSRRRTSLYFGWISQIWPSRSPIIWGGGGLEGWCISTWIGWYTLQEYQGEISKTTYGARAACAEVWAPRLSVVIMWTVKITASSALTVLYLL